MELDGYAVVIGGASGIGAQCARAFASEGVVGLAIGDLDLDLAEIVSRDCKKHAKREDIDVFPFKVDSCEESSVEGFVIEVTARFGRIDYAVHTAGIGIETPFEFSDTPLSEFERFMKINATGTLLAIQAFSRAMKEQTEIPHDRYSPLRRLGRGSIVVLGSCNSYVATPHIVSYTAAKHAVLGIARTAALDNAPHGIRVNCLCPSWVEGPMIERAIQGDPNLAKVMERVVPLGRIAQPDEVSDVVMFLCSPRSSYVTGGGWLVDGGATLQLQT